MEKYILPELIIENPLEKLEGKKHYLFLADLAMWNKKRIDYATSQIGLFNYLAKYRQLNGYVRVPIFSVDRTDPQIKVSFMIYTGWGTKCEFTKYNIPATNIFDFSKLRTATLLDVRKYLVANRLQKHNKPTLKIFYATKDISQFKATSYEQNIRQCDFAIGW